MEIKNKFTKESFKTIYTKYKKFIEKPPFINYGLIMFSLLILFHASKVDNLYFIRVITSIILGIIITERSINLYKVIKNKV